MSSDSGSDSDTNVASCFKRGMQKFSYIPIKTSYQNCENDKHEVPSSSSTITTDSPEVTRTSTVTTEETKLVISKVAEPLGDETKSSNNVIPKVAEPLGDLAKSSNNNTINILNQISPRKRTSKSPRISQRVKKATPVRSESGLLIDILKDKSILKGVPTFATIDDKLKSLSQKCEQAMEMGEKSGTKSKKKKGPKKKQPVRGKKISEEIHELSTDEDDIVIKEDINPIVYVNLLWRSVHKKSFKVLKFDKLDMIVEHLTKTYEVDPRLLLFTIDEKEVDLSNNTYASLRLNEGNLIEGGVLPDSYLEKGTITKKDNKSKGIKFRAQLNYREYFDVFILPSDTMEILYSQVSSEAKLRIDKFKILYDGQRVKFNDTFNSLGLEEGDVFDVVPIQ